MSYYGVYGSTFEKQKMDVGKYYQRYEAVFRKFDYQGVEIDISQTLEKISVTFWDGYIKYELSCGCNSEGLYNQNVANDVECIMRFVKNKYIFEYEEIDEFLGKRLIFDRFDS